MQPLKDKVKNFILEEINKGHFENGKMPSERVLSEELNVSRGTLRTALNDMEEEGLISRYRNKGTYLNDPLHMDFKLNKSLVLIFPAQFDYSTLISSAFYSSIYFSLVKEASQKKLSLITFNENDLGLKLLIEKCKSINIYGFVLMPNSIDNQYSIIEKLTRFKSKVILIDDKFDHKNVTSFNMDSRNGSKIAVQHLFELGHRKIGFINHPRWEQLNPERFMGYKDGLSSVDLPFDKNHVLTCPSNIAAKNKVLTELLMQKNKPTGLVCYSEYYAWSIAGICLREGVKIPGEISLVSFAGYAVHGLKAICNTICFKNKNIGRLLLDCIESQELGGEDKLLEVEIEDNGCCLKIN